MESWTHRDIIDQILRALQIVHDTETSFTRKYFNLAQTKCL